MATTGWDEGQVFYSDSIAGDGASAADSQRTNALREFREFLQHFRSGTEFPYR